VIDIVTKDYYIIPRISEITKYIISIYYV
jgi:hypothetical protein